MKMRRVTVLTFLVLACLCHAGADDPLLSLANGWGKGTIIDFRKTVYKNEASCMTVGLFDTDSGVKRCEHGARSAECLQRAA